MDYGLLCSYAIIYQLYSCSFDETLMGGLLQLDIEPSFMIIFLLISHLDSNIVISSIRSHDGVAEIIH